MIKRPPLIDKLEEAKFFFFQRYGFNPDTLALSPLLVKALMRALNNLGKLPAKRTTEYEFLGCEVVHLKAKTGNFNSKPWQFMFQATRGGQLYQQHGVMNMQELGVTEVQTVIHDGVIKMGYDEDAPEAEVLTGGKYEQ